MSKLSVRVDEIEEATTKINEAQKEIDYIIRDLENVKNEVVTEWEGASGSTYVSMLEGYITDLKNVKNSLDGINDYATTVSAKMGLIDSMMKIMGIFEQVLKGE